VLDSGGVDRDELNSYLDDVLIGGRERRKIVIAEYDPAWPGRFERERERIAAAIGPLAKRIEHIGSTAVPGLAAKPIIDVLVTVADPDDESAFAPALEYEPLHRGQDASDRRDPAAGVLRCLH
jgi:GrpB-like predicted nucleotidyltransferase (UPF0157 family)